MKRDLAGAVSEIVLRSGSVRVVDIAAELAVSEVTVRKALDLLERRGLVKRFHGEARAYDGDDIPFRMGRFYSQKLAIAKAAATLVERGDTILIEAGSAAALLAEELKSLRDLSVVTTNLFIARIFRGSRVRVILTGGSYQEESESLVGSVAIQGLAGLGFSKAFIGVSGFSPEAGFTLNDFARAEVTRAILARGAANYVLTDSSKFGSSHAAVVCSELSLLKGVITDPGIPDAHRDLIEAAGAGVLLCAPPTARPRAR